MNRDGFIIIQSWMLALNFNSCAELNAYALIYSYCHEDGEHVFHGGIKYIAKWLMCSTRNATRVLRNLEQKKFIRRIPVITNGVCVNCYMLEPLENSDIKQPNIEIVTDVMGIDKMSYPPRQNVIPPSTKCHTYNKVDNKVDNNTPSISIFPPIGENTLIPPEGECESSQQIEEVSKDELEFDKFRKVYRGTKRGLKTEFENFKKKHRDWREVLKTLQACYEHQCELKDAARKKGCFVPQEKNLQTYINQRCWEEEPQFAPAKVEKEEPTIIDKLRGIEESRRERERVNAFFDEIIEQEKRQQKPSNYEPF